MNIDPLIEVQGAKRISLQKAATSVGKFTSIVCNDNAVSILNKQQRLSKPSEHVSEKLKVLVASMNEEMDAFTAASTDAAAKSTGNNVVNSSTPTSKSRNNRNEVAASSSANKRKLLADTDTGTGTGTGTDTKSNNADASKAKVEKSPRSSKKPKSKSKIK